MYINFRVKFIVIIVSMLLYTFLDIFGMTNIFGVTDIRKWASLDDHFFSVCSPNLEKFKRIFNLSNALDEFAINFSVTSILNFFFCMKVDSFDFFFQKFEKTIFCKGHSQLWKNTSKGLTCANA